MDGLIDDTARRAGEAWTNYDAGWWRWTNRALLIIGSCLMLAGVIFFFAFNWERLPSWIKFGAIQVALATMLISAWRVGFEQLVGKVLLLAATVMCGVALAVFGQVYQTGADAFELFVGWAVLCLGWVVVARFDMLWLIWLVIANLGLGLYAAQVAVANDKWSWATACGVVACANAAWLAVREVAVNRGWNWGVRAAWLRWTVWAQVVLSLSLPVVWWVAVGRENESARPYFIACALLACAIGLGGKYFWRRRDLGAIAICALAVCGVVLAGAGRGLLMNFDGGGLWLFGLLTIAIFGIAAWWLRSLGERVRKEKL